MFRTYLIACFLFLTCTFVSCNRRTNTLILESNYKGWIYIIKASDKITQRVFRPDSFGIVYMPKEAFNEKKTLIIQVGSQKLEEVPFTLYRTEFSPEERGSKHLTYYKFYYPFAGEPKNEQALDLNGKTMDEFQYLYYSEVIDQFRVYWE